MWRTLRSRQTNPYASRTERWLMDKELSFMQAFLRSIWKQATNILKYLLKEKTKIISWKSILKGSVLKLLYLSSELWQIQCLHVPSYILQCNSYSLPLIRTLKKESMSKIRWYWIQQWENTVHGRQITNPVQIRTIFSVI